MHASFHMSTCASCCPFSLVSFHSASITKTVCRPVDKHLSSRARTPCVSCQGMGDRELPGVALADCQIDQSPAREGSRKACRSNTHPPSRALLLRAKERRTSPAPGRPSSNVLRRIRLGLCACSRRLRRRRRLCPCSHRVVARSRKQEDPFGSTYRSRSRIYSR